MIVKNVEIFKIGINWLNLQIIRVDLWESCEDSCNDTIRLLSILLNTMLKLLVYYFCYMNYNFSKTNNRISEFDMIKGFAIISVIILHCLESHSLYKSFAFAHIWQAVPLFVLISFILLFNKIKRHDKLNLKEYYNKNNIQKIIKRIILPFLLIQLILILFISLWYIIHGKIYYIHLSDFLLSKGPGSYYPFIYLQIWIITPVLFIILTRFKYGVGIMFLIISLLTILTALWISNDFVYHRLIIRYLFIGILAWLYCNDYIRLRYLIPLALLSIAYYISLIVASPINYSPFLDSRWNTQQLPTFFYTLFLFIFLLKIFKLLNENFPKISKLLIYLGKNSYEIFLLQMFWLALIYSYETEIVDSITRWGYCLLVIFISIAPIWIYKKLIIIYKLRKNKSKSQSSQKNELYA